MKTVINEDCFVNQHKIAQISSKKTFCAIGENAGPCQGDSGKYI